MSSARCYGIAFDIIADTVIKYLHGIKLIESDFGLYLYDAHGNVTELLDNEYNVVQSYTYDPFGIENGAESSIRDTDMAEEMGIGGDILIQSPDNNDAIDDAAGLHIQQAFYVNPYRYCGEYCDDETGYVYLRARYYAPTLGRFISEDTAKDGYNWYVYCGNDPVNYVDPSGEFAISALLIAIGVDAVVGAGFNAGSQLISKDFDFSKLDVTSILASGAAGAVSGALGFFTAGICSSTLLGAMAAGAASNTAEYLAYNIVAGNEITWGGVSTAAASGAISGAIGYGIGRLTEYADPANRQCFIAGTLVLTATGFVAIETIKAGDKVLAANPETGEQAVKTVVQTFVNETDELVHVTVNGKVITTTPEHPFYVPQKGWTGTIHLRAGDILVSSNGEYVVVEKVEHELLENSVKVYNFEVEDFHTYYVSEYGVLVHNICHGNSKLSSKPQHGYEIYDIDSDDVVKTGISGQPLNKNGTSPRANRQVNSLNRKAGYQKYGAKVVATDIPNRSASLEWEINNTTRLFKQNNTLSEHLLPRPRI